MRIALMATFALLISIGSALAGPCDGSNCATDGKPEGTPRSLCNDGGNCARSEQPPPLPTLQVPTSRAVKDPLDGGPMQAKERLGPSCNPECQSDGLKTEPPPMASLRAGF
jgi:hypothetical protein